LCLPGWETGLKTKQKGRKQERGVMGRAGVPAPGGGNAGGPAPWVPGIRGERCGEREAVGGDADVREAPRPNGENARDGR